MGHKTHPLGFRLGITEEHKSAWYSKLNVYSQVLKEDYIIRECISNLFDRKKDSFGYAAISKILITRNSLHDRIDIIIHTARPGLVVGENGAALKKMDQQLNKLIKNKIIRIDLVEIEHPYQHADLLADILVEQLELRVPFRRAMKSIVERAQEEKIKGIKVQVAGRLNGAEIARTEWLREGRVPLQTLRANIDYSYKTAQTTYGILGIRIWLFKGEVL